jgi:hypothetical protein
MVTMIEIDGSYGEGGCMNGDPFMALLRLEVL